MTTDSDEPTPYPYQGFAMTLSYEPPFIIRVTDMEGKEIQMETERPYAPDADEPGHVDSGDYTLDWWQASTLASAFGPGKSGPAAHLVELAELRAQYTALLYSNVQLSDENRRLTAANEELQRELVEVPDAETRTQIRRMAMYFCYTYPVIEGFRERGEAVLAWLDAMEVRP